MPPPFKFLRFYNPFGGKKDASTKGVLPEDSNPAELEGREIEPDDPDALEYLESILDRNAKELGKGNGQFTTHATKQELEQLTEYITDRKIKPDQLPIDIADKIFTYDPKIAKLFMRNRLDPNAVMEGRGRYLSSQTSSAARPNLLVMLNSARLKKNFDISADIAKEVNPALLGPICSGSQKQGYIIPFLTEKCGVDLKHKYQYAGNSESLIELTTFTGSVSAIEALVREGGEVTSHFLRNVISKNVNQEQMEGRKLMQPEALMNMAIYERTKKVAMESAPDYSKESPPSKLKPYHRGTLTHLVVASEECLFEEVDALINAEWQGLSHFLLHHTKTREQWTIVQNNHVHVYRIILMLDELREHGADTDVIELLQKACETENSQEYRDVLLQYLLNWALQERFESWVENNPGQEKEFDQMGNLREIVVENELLERAIKSGNAALVEYLAESTGIEISEEQVKLAQSCVDAMPVEKQEFSDERMQLIADFADMYDSHLKKDLDFIAQTKNEKALDTLYKMLNENWDLLAEYYKSSNSPEGVLEVMETKLAQQQVKKILQNPKAEWLDNALQDLSDIINDITKTALEDRKTVSNWLATLQDSNADLPRMLEKMQRNFLNMESEINKKIRYLKLVADQYTKSILSSGRSENSELIKDVHENVKKAIALVEVNHLEPLAGLIYLVQSKQAELTPREKPEAAMLSEEQPLYDEDEDLYMHMSSLGPDNSVPAEKQEKEKELHYAVSQLRNVRQHQEAAQNLQNAWNQIDALRERIGYIVLPLRGSSNLETIEKQMMNLYDQGREVQLSLDNLRAAISSLKIPKNDPLIAKVSKYARVLSNAASDLEELVSYDSHKDCAKIMDDITLNLHNLQQEAKVRLLTEQLTDPEQQIEEKLEAIQDFILSALDTEIGRAAHFAEAYEKEYLPLRVGVPEYGLTRKEIIDNHRNAPKMMLDLHTAKSDASLYRQIGCYIAILMNEAAKSEDEVRDEAICEDIKELICNKIPQGHLLENPESLLKSIDDLLLKHSTLADQSAVLMKKSEDNGKKPNFADDVTETDEMRHLRKKVRLVQQMAKLAPPEKEFSTIVAQAYWELKDAHRKIKSLEKEIEEELQTKLKKIYKDLGSDLGIILNVKLRKRVKKMIKIKQYEESLERFAAVIKESDELTPRQDEQKKAIIENLEDTKAEVRAVEENRAELSEEKQMKLHDKETEIAKRAEKEIQKSGEKLQKRWEKKETKMITKLEERAEKKGDKVVEAEMKDLKEFLSNVDMRRALKDAIDQATEITKQCHSVQQSIVMKSGTNKLSKQILSKFDNVSDQLTECRQNVKSFKKGSLGLSLEDCEKMVHLMKKIPIKELEVLRSCLKMGLYTSVNTKLNEIAENLSSALDLIPDRWSDFRPKATAETVRYGPDVHEELKQVVNEVSKVGDGIKLEQTIGIYDFVRPVESQSKTELPASAKRGGSDPPDFPPPPPPTGRGV